MKINFTGFTPAHNAKGNRKGIVQVPLLLQNIMADAGHEVGYNLENADLHVIHLYVLNSLNSSHAVECLELMKNDNVILALDDWHIKDMYYSYQKTVENKKFSKTHPSIDWRGILDNLDSLQKIVDGKFDVLVPAYPGGDISLLGINGNVQVYDPSIYVEKQIPEILGKHDLMPVHASLANDWKWLNKRKYSYIQVQSEHEDKVFEYYCKHRMVLSPPYYHSGSGWWRNRYTLANIAGALIVEDDNTLFGDTYTIDPRKVNEKNFDKYFDMQNKAFHNRIWSKEENISKMKEYLKKYE
jgi:hypothetical protein